MIFDDFKAAVVSDSAIRFTTFLTADGSGFERPDGSREPAVVAPTVYPGGQPLINVLDDGDVVELRTVLDSVASQANRVEDALDRYVHANEAFKFPLVEIEVDKSTRLSGLLLPHRAADAYLRATDDTAYFKQIFEMSLGQVSYDENCTLALERSPADLVFGSWNASVNALARTARAFRSHIDGITRIPLSTLVARGKAADPAEAIKVFGLAMRRDPFIGNSATLYNYYEKGEKLWTTDAKKASAEDKKKAAEIAAKTKKSGTDAKKSGDEDKNPFSLASHGLGDIPVRNKSLRGVRIDYAIQSSVISLATLRSFRFPLKGKVIAERDLAGQTYIAALALLGYELARSRGYFLRSGCSLVATESRREVVALGQAKPIAPPWDGNAGKSDLHTALALYEAAVADIAEHKFLHTDAETEDAA
jgi:CRISPR-associated protein Csb1